MEEGLINLGMRVVNREKKRCKERWLSDEEKRYGDEGKKKN